ncbi:MAG: porin, partial [Caldimicrobium sp.]
KKLYNYYALQGGYKWDTKYGEGNVRIYGFKTNKKFPDWQETKKKARKGWGLSFDQEIIKDLVGIFARFGYQDDSAQISYKSMYEIGLNSNFCILNKKITWGLGYAFLKAPSKHEDLKKSQIIETYLAIPIYQWDNKISSTLSFDWQYVKDFLKEEKDKRGNVWGVRLNLAF